MDGQRAALATLNPNRMSLGGSRAGKAAPMKTRSSMASSRQSLAPQPSRNQSNNQPLSRRSSVHGGRPSSIHGSLSTNPGIRSDPRPISDKAFQKEAIAKIILYCSTHNYDKPLAPKALTGPSAKDFKSLCLFLFRRIDPMYDWSQSINQPNSQTAPLTPEEDIKKFLRWIGYPFNVSKNALQAAGTPHTWPALLAMLSWLVDLLSYCDAVQSEEEQSCDISQLDPAKPEKMFFEYVNQSYEMYMSGNDPSRADDMLHKSFGIRNQSIQTQIERDQAEQSRLEAELQSFQTAEADVVALTEKKRQYTEDIGKFRSLLSEVALHLETVDRKLNEKQSEAATIKSKRTQMEAAKQVLVDAIAAQSLTPTQVSALNHQYSMLSSALIDLEAKKTRIELDRFQAEANEQHAINELHEAVANFNANQAIVTEIETEITLTINRAPETGILSIEPDLKHVVKHQLSKIRDSFTAKLNQLTTSVSTTRDDCRVLTEALAESERALREMQVSLTRREESYQAQRHGMNTELSALVTQVEQIEARIAAQSGPASTAEAERVHAEHELQQLITEKSRILSDLSADRSRSHSEAFQLIEACMSHHAEIRNRIAQLNTTAEQIKRDVQSQEIPQLD